MFWYIYNTLLASARFIFNTYCHMQLLVLRRIDVTLHIKEGDTQDDLLDMILFIGLVKITWALHQLVMDVYHQQKNNTLQVWYAHALALVSTLARIKDWFAELIRIGPKLGYHK